MTSTHERESFSSNYQIAQSAEPEDISIVMPVYNHEASVAEAIESAMMQKMHYESVIYCFDDASTDKSGEILSDYAKRYPDKIKVYTSPVNFGSGKKAILYHQPPVKGRYWCFLEGDDYWTSSEKLAKQIAFLDSYPDYVGCSCNTVMKNEITGEESIIRPDRNTWNLLDLMARRYGFYVHTASIIWRNIYLDQGSFLPPLFKKKYVFGDYMLMHVMLHKGAKMQNIPEVMSCYRVTGRGVWTSKHAKEQAETNAILRKLIRITLPFKYKIIIILQKLRLRSNILKNIIPGPVNE